MPERALPDVGLGEPSPRRPTLRENHWTSGRRLATVSGRTGEATILRAQMVTDARVGSQRETGPIAGALERAT